MSSDNAIYEEVTEMTGKDMHLSKNVSYECITKIDHSDAIAKNRKFTTVFEKYTIAFVIAFSVLALSLVAASTGFALKITRLQSEINSLTTLQRADTTRLDNITVQVQVTAYNKVSLLHQALNAVSDKLDNLAMAVATLDQSLENIAILLSLDLVLVSWNSLCSSAFVDQWL